MTVGSTTNRTTNTAGTSSSRSRSQNTHTVKQGESLWSIARDKSGGRNNAEISRYHQDLIQANPQLRNPDVIKPGQELSLPEARTSGGTGTSQTQQARGADGRSSYESSSTAPPPQTARPDGAALTGVAANPALSAEVNVLRANANANPTGRAGGGSGDAQREPAGPIHGRTDLGRRAMPNANLYGNNFSTSRDRGTDVNSGTHRSHAESRRTENRGAEQYRDTNSETVETTRGGQRTHQLQEENQMRNRVTGESVTERTTVAQDQDGRSGSRTTNSSEAGDVDRRNRLRRAAHENGQNAVSATGVLFDESIAGDDRYRGVHTNDQRHTTDDTGAGYETHAVAYRARANAAGTVDLRNAEVNVGVGASMQADLVGASGRAQLGSRESVAGQGFVEGAGHVGGRAEGTAGVVLSPNQAGVRVGGEAFIGAEVRATTGYENRWGGASVTARGQAGAGVAAGLDVGYDNGRVGFRGDLGAAVGLGGRVTVDVNVNVGAIASDVGTSAQAAGTYVADTASRAGSAISDGASRARTAVADRAASARDAISDTASSAWRSINPFD